MKAKIIRFLKFIDLFDYLKIVKNKFIKTKNEKNTEEKRYNFYSQFITKNNLCFDVGANYGNRTETFLKLGANVVAIEPQPLPLKFLRRKFSNKITIFNKALGAKPGKAIMYVSSASSLTTLSENWINKVRVGRFKESSWEKKIEVEVTTLDEIIKIYGIPDFCKIDVEGYEWEVLSGLSRPLKLLSFEYTIPEFTEQAVNILNYLETLGKIMCNYSPGETLELGLDSWLLPDKFIHIFRTLPAKGIIDGDIYVKFLND